jgi:hypothetical protein
VVFNHVAILSGRTKPTVFNLLRLASRVHVSKPKVLEALMNRTLKTFVTKFAGASLALGAVLLVLNPVTAFAQRGVGGGRVGGYSGGRAYSGSGSRSQAYSGRSFSGGGQSFYGGSRSYSGRGNVYSGRGYSGGGQQFYSGRGFSGGGGGYNTGRFYAGRGYYYGGRFWARPYFGVGIGIPFGFGYYTDRGCGYYDGYGYWQPAPCYSDSYSYGY